MCASLFQGANLLLFTPCSSTCAPFNLHCCSRSLFQSAVVLIASPWWSQLTLLPEKCCVSLNEENRQDAIDWEKERGMVRERIDAGGKLWQTEGANRERKELKIYDEMEHSFNIAWSSLKHTEWPTFCIWKFSSLANHTIITDLISFSHCHHFKTFKIL